MKTCVVLGHLNGVLKVTFTTLEYTRKACEEHLEVFKVLGYACFMDFF